MTGCHVRWSSFAIKNLLGNEVGYGRIFWKHKQHLVTITSFPFENHGFQWSNYWQFSRNRQLLSQQYIHTRFPFRSEKGPVNRNNFTTSTDNTKDNSLTDGKPSKQVSGNGKASGNSSGTGSEEKLTVFQRFKKTYKEHGKVLIVVHLLTSAVWFGSFFYAAKVGVDIIPVLEWLGLSEKIISPFRNSSLGDIALAYLMYKLATPARYTVTLTGTNFAIRYLRKTGRMQPKSASTSLRTLAKDSRTELRQKRSEILRKTRNEVSVRQHRLAKNIKERHGRMTDSMRARISQFRAKWNMPRRGKKKSGLKK